MTITLERVPASGPARDELTALLPGYLRGLGVDAHYPYLPLYWTEAGRFPYLIREQGRTAGFALVRQLPDSGAFEMAEFCVLPDFRARGLGAQAARALFAAHPGAWRIGIMANNAGALRFWRTVAPQAAVQPPREADGEDGFWMLSLPGAPPTRASDQTAPPQDAQQVRVATPADTPAILAVDALALADPARARQITRAIEQGQCRVAVDAGRIVGYVMQDHGFFGHGFVSLIVVAAACRRQGVALRLLQAAVTACDTAKLFTSTNQSNVAARRLMAKAGFVPSGMIENLDEGDPELVYVKFVR